MEALISYAIKSGCILLLFSVLYYVLLRKETFFKTNRFFLLSGLLVAIILPLLTFTKTIWVDPVPMNEISEAVHPVMVQAEVIPVDNMLVIDWFSVIGTVYLLGVLFFIGQFVFDYYALRKILSGKTIRNIGNYRIIETSDDLTPFSWFRYIVYNPAFYTASELENILEHEKTHCRQWHSADVIFSRLFCIAFWFNPSAWLHKSMIIQNLEFIADSEASEKIASRKNYQLTLLKVTAHENCLAFSNHFYQSLIKKRIVMLNKKASKKRSLWKYGIVLPLLVVFMLQFQVNVVAQEKATVSDHKVDMIAADLSPEITDEELDSGVKKLAAMYGITLEFSGIKRDKNGNIIYLIVVAKDKKGKALKYAVAATDGDTINTFRFYIKNPEQADMTFGFEEVSEIRTGVKEVVPEDSYYLDKNKDTVAVAKTVPVNLRKSGDGYSTITPEKEPYVHTYTFGPYTKTTSTEDGNEVTEIKNFLVMINGKEYLSSELKDYRIATTGTFTVLTKEEAKAYGEKGKDGVIVFPGNKTTMTKIKNTASQNNDTKTITISNGFEVVFYDENKMKVPGKAPVVFGENEPELLIDGLKQSNPEASMKKLDVMKIKNIEVNTKADGSRQILIRTE